MGSDNGRAAGNRANQRFQSTLPLWGATGVRIFAPGVQPDFNPRSPCGERQHQLPGGVQIVMISIHAPLVGSDTTSVTTVIMPKYFNPRSPCGERLPLSFPVSCWHNISIHAPLVGSDRAPEFPPPFWGISIHAPLVGSDHFVPVHGLALVGFQSTLPLWGATVAIPDKPKRRKFQSTLPLWGATCRGQRVVETIYHFNPRSPCGERPPGK